jgi:hypothetical protein
MYDHINNGYGPLRQVLANAINGDGSPLSSLTVLSPQNDPYRLDLPDSHRNGQWFAEVVVRLVPSGRVHLRGLHYRLVSAADVIRPDNSEPYINTDEAWDWLQNKAAKSGRWLGYVDFDRISDERNAAPEIFLPEKHSGSLSYLVQGVPIELPSLISATPRLYCGAFHAQQPYRICFIGEKTSLREVLLPLAQRVNGELCLPTGEATDTMIHGIAARAVEDGRPTVCLYFSDFDPSGHQMPVSVARKLQALRDLKFPTLNIQVIAACLTLEQVERLGLPSSPLKETERRADKWKRTTGHEQVEIDSLAALQPDELRRIARDAVEPFFDFSLARRLNEASEEWHTEANEQLIDHPSYQECVEKITDALNNLEEAKADYDQVQQDSLVALRGIELPHPDVPEPEIETQPPAPLFTTTDDFATASRRLIAHKALET